MNFGTVTSELTELICELPAKSGIFSRISPDVLYRFSQSFQYVKALWVLMIDLDLIFRFVKGHCHGNQMTLEEVMNVD